MYSNSLKVCANPIRSVCGIEVFLVMLLITLLNMNMDYSV